MENERPTLTFGSLLDPSATGGTERLLDAIREDHNGYTLTQGAPALREAIARHLAEDVGWTVGEDGCDLMVTSGTSGALLLACMALLNPGRDEGCPPLFCRLI